MLQIIPYQRNGLCTVGRDLRDHTQLKGQQGPHAYSRANEWGRPTDIDQLFQNGHVTLLYYRKEKEGRGILDTMDDAGY